MLYTSKIPFLQSQRMQPYTVHIWALLLKIPQSVLIWQTAFVLILQKILPEWVGLRITTFLVSSQSRTQKIFQVLKYECLDITFTLCILYALSKKHKTWASQQTYRSLKNFLFQHFPPSTEEMTSLDDYISKSGNSRPDKDQQFFKTEKIKVQWIFFLPLFLSSAF